MLDKKDLTIEKASFLPDAPEGLRVYITDNPAISCHLGIINNTPTVGFGAATVVSPHPSDIEEQEKLNALVGTIAQDYGYTLPDLTSWTQQKKRLKSWHKTHQTSGEYGFWKNGATCYPAIFWSSQDATTAKSDKYFVLAWGIPSHRKDQPKIKAFTNAQPGQDFVSLQDGLSKTAGFSAHDLMQLAGKTHPIWDEIQAAYWTLRDINKAAPASKGLAWTNNYAATPTYYYFSLPKGGKGRLIRTAYDIILQMRYSGKQLSLRENQRGTLTLNRGTGSDSRFNSKEDAQEACEKVCQTLEDLQIKFPRFKAENFETQRRYLKSTVLDKTLKATERKLLKIKETNEAREEAKDRLDDYILGQLCGTIIQKPRYLQAQLFQVQENPANGRKILKQINYGSDKPLTKKWAAKFLPLEDNTFLSTIRYIGYEENRPLIEAQHRAAIAAKTHNPLYNYTLEQEDHQTTESFYKTAKISSNDTNWCTLYAWGKGTDNRVCGWAIAIDFFDTPTPSYFFRPMLNHQNAYVTPRMKNTIIHALNTDRFAPYKDKALPYFLKQLKEIGEKRALF